MAIGVNELTKRTTSEFQGATQPSMAHQPVNHQNSDGTSQELDSFRKGQFNLNEPRLSAGLGGNFLGKA